MPRTSTLTVVLLAVTWPTTVRAACTLPDVAPLYLVRSSADVAASWAIDPTATGYDMFRVTDKSLLPGILGEPVHLNIPEQSPTFPVLDVGAVPAAAGLTLFYQVHQVCGLPCGTDSDGDRLDDCVETNTGIFVDATNTGTDPNNPDTDGDEIDDGDEVLGTLGGLDLPAMGASPVHKDLFVEYDWFDDDNECAAHSHRPTPGMLDRVTATFAAAPVPNPDGIDGITYHHDYGQGGAFTGGNFIDDPDGNIAGHVEGGEFLGYKANHFAANRHRYFHYCLLPHRYNTNSGSSGYAEINGDDFIVSLYCFNSETNVANTIVHELGHNIGLRHGGFENCNWKPNYNSVMNYKYQFPGVDDDCTPPGNGVLDYSRGTRINLDENALNELMGTCGSTPVDWNGNTVLEPLITYDVNRDNSNNPQNGSCGGNLTVLRDHNDWNAVNFGGINDGDLARELVECSKVPPGAQ